MTTFFYRLMGAAMLDGGTYEQLEGDRHAMPQAVVVVILSSLAAGAGAGLRGGDLLGFLEISGLALVTWIAWAVLTLQIGTRFLPEPQTRATAGQLLRTIGFAAAPGLLQVFGVIPGVTTTVFAITTAWMFVAMVAAIRHALDYSSVTRALLVCATAAVLILSLVFAIGLIFAPAAS